VRVLQNIWGVVHFTIASISSFSPPTTISLSHKLCSSCYNQVQVQEKYTLHALNTPLSTPLNPYKKITIRDFSVDLFLRNNIILKGLVTWI